MVKAYIDGKLLYDPGSGELAHTILSPRLDLDINGAGSFSFVMPPGNALYDGIRKMRSIVTVTMDDDTIFRGRAANEETDTYKQKEVYCEGDRSFLLDSVSSPQTYTGNVQAYFRQLVESHNAQVEAEKRFTVGVITAVSNSLTMEAEDKDYGDTWSRMEKRLLSAYGGWIRTRTEGGVTYLDWLTKEGSATEQDVQFGVNLLDIKDKLDASRVFTRLIPLGESTVDENGEQTPPVTIESVNGGLNYIRDDAAEALYGKIWRTQTWPDVSDPAILLTKAREFMATGIAVQSLTLQFVDMHFTDSSKRRVLIGDHPRITSEPHGLSLSPICVTASLDLVNPEKSTYTFGEAPRTLTENVIEVDEDVSGVTGRRGGGGRGVKEELSEVLRWAKIRVDEANANINLNAGEINKLTGRMSQAEIDIDGVNAKILLKADATIVDDLGTRVSSAEISIDGLNSEIALKADKITLQGYVTATQLKTEFSNFESGISDSLYVRALSSSGFECTSFTYKGSGMSLKSASFLTSSTSLTVNSTGGTVTGVTLNKKTNTIYYMSWE
jgi:hypothetical protein